LDPLHYEHFKTHLARGDRAGAANHIQRFVASFEAVDDKIAWVKWYLENEDLGHRIRHEIYEHLVFPVLLEGYRQSDPWSLRWLVRTAQNLYRADHLWTQVGRKTEQGLLAQLHTQCPSDDEVRQALLQSHLRDFQYMVHEWPAGILYGHDGASAEECQLILSDLRLARQLDSSHANGAFFDDFENKVTEYQSRLDRAKHSDA
jgi:hypothetical protein